MMPSPGDGASGSRLGLTLSRVHARLAAGDLTVEDRADGGSAFRLWLPAAPAPAPRPYDDETPGRSLDEEPSLTDVP